MQTFYHGSHSLFDKFDLLHALEGDRKIKFGFGVYDVEPNLLGRLLMELRDAKLERIPV